MKPEDRERFTIAMGVMGEAFQKTPSESLAEIYFKVLQDFDIEDFERACLTLINTRKITGTFPLVAEIREAVAGGGETMEARALFAWEKLMYGIARHCPYDSVKFDDPIIHAIIALWGGWTEMGDWPIEETKWKRIEFLKIYQAYAVSMNFDAPKTHLVGLIEFENCQKGWSGYTPASVLIAGKPGKVESFPYQEPEIKQIAGASK